MGRALLFAMVTLAIAAPATAHACTPPMAAVQDRETGAYLASVTSVYRAVAEDFTPVDSRYPSDNFSVLLRPTEAIWGEAPSGPVQLTFTAGACIDWDLWGGRSDDEPVEGQRYLVFFAPKAAADASLLRVVPDDYASGQRMISLWRIVQAGRSLSEEQPQPAYSALTPALPWLGAGAASLASLIAGFFVGRFRARRATRNK